MGLLCRCGFTNEHTSWNLYYYFVCLLQLLLYFQGYRNSVAPALQAEEMGGVLPWRVQALRPLSPPQVARDSFTVLEIKNIGGNQ